ncbi:MAG: flagellar motor switch protein FliN [Alphaproteobacteria bacterium]|nr:flagellar motor switch protein FliN [Alphaproteobacteria bacterium]
MLTDDNAVRESLDLDEIAIEDGVEGEEAAPVLGNKVTEDEVVRLATDLEAVYDVPVQVSAVLGKTKMEVSQLLKLGRGAVVELDRKVGEAIDIYVNNRLVARGEVVVVDERLGVTMTEIIKTDRS